MASKSKCIPAPVASNDKPGKASKTPEPTPAPVKGRKAPATVQPAPEPSGKGKGRKTAIVATAANATSAPPAPKTKGRKVKEEAPAAPAKKGKGKAPVPETTAPPKKGKASAQPAAAPPALREVKWTEERITVFRTMRRLKATSPARARTAEAIAIEAECTPFRIKEMGYGGNVTRGVLGKDASPFRLHGLIAVAEPGQVASDYSAGGRSLCYYLTEKGCAVVLPGDKAPRKK